jgi:hypothetical protein
MGPFFKVDHFDALWEEPCDIRVYIRLGYMPNFDKVVDDQKIYSIIINVIFDKMGNWREKNP